MNEHRIPSILQSSDIVYHYCDLDTAVQFILHEKRLRLSNRKNSIDPIENKKPFISYSQSGWDPNIKTSGDHLKVRDLQTDLLSNAKQLCLCMNDETYYHSNINPAYPYEYFGFLKPRMWDQYGDKYQGVCLAFSLDALKRNASEYINGKIEYVDYKRFNVSHKSIDVNRVEEIGVSDYWKADFERLKNRMFRKHLDYKDENEYRFLSFSSNEYDYIDITGCLKGIVIADGINEFMREALNYYAAAFEVEMLYIRWDDTGVSFTSKEELDTLLVSIHKMFSKPQKLTPSGKWDEDALD